MDQHVEKLIAISKERWPTFVGLLAALLAVFILSTTFLNGVNLAAINGIGWGIITLALMAVCVFWWKTHLPKAAENKVGIGVALYLEDDTTSKKLVDDFNYTLRTLLQGSGLKHEFQFVEVPKFISKKLVDNHDYGHVVAKKCNLSFLLFGKVFTREVAGKPAHFIDLHGFIRHVPIDQNLSRRFGVEFRQSLPMRYEFSNDSAFPACEFAARNVEIVAKYIIGIAAVFSRDFEYAEQLLLAANQLVVEQNKSNQTPQSLALQERIATQIVGLYRSWIAFEMRFYTDGRNLEALQRCNGLIERLRAFEKEGQGYNDVHQVAAICAFVLDRDLEKAKKEIRACKNKNEVSWRYSEAFLLAYEGNLDDSYREYARAFNAPLVDPSIPNQCEEFINIVLEQEPQRAWLYFSLGLINFKAKVDLTSAANDFQKFLDKTEGSEFAKHHRIVKGWILQIEETRRRLG